jgi:hypothetical protein
MCKKGYLLSFCNSAFFTNLWFAFDWLSDIHWFWKSDCIRKNPDRLIEAKDALIQE